MRSLFLTILMSVFIMAGGLVTGESKKFVPGDKVLFSTDFSKCPVGEIPEEFDKVDGVGECVKMDDNIWFSSARNNAFLIKDINLTKKEFSIEYDVYFLQDNCHGIDLHYFSNVNRTNEIGDMKTWVGPGCYGERFYIGVAKLGNLYKTKYKSIKKKKHIAIQYRRGLYRIYFDGKRIASFPAKFEKLNSIMFEIVGNYSQLIDNIKIAIYTHQEKKPEPEKLGINVTKTQKGYSLNIPEKVLFDFNKFTLKDEAKKALDVVGAFIKEKNIKQIRVIGYTDNIGSDEYNLKLSLQRAQSVADYLINCAKIDAKLFKIEGKGKANPIAPNDSDENRAKNRRVEIELIK